MQRLLDNLVANTDHALHGVFAAARTLRSNSWIGSRSESSATRVDSTATRGLDTDTSIPARAIDGEETAADNLGTAIDRFGITIYIREIGADISGIAADISGITANSRESAADIRETAIDWSEIDTYIREIGIYIVGITADILEMAINWQDVNNLHIFQEKPWLKANQRAYHAGEARANGPFSFQPGPAAQGAGPPIPRGLKDRPIA